ncbi:MAG: S-methyl-5-thioribose-1-phosphate isomerase [Pseudomonadota bacterium]
METIQPIIWEDDTLKLLDQRVLPQKYTYLELNNLRESADAITDMVVRGAPAIGITAAYAIVLGAREHYLADKQQWKRLLSDDLEYLAQARPTAVNLFWAIEQMQVVIDGISDVNPFDSLLAKAAQIHEDDINANKTMGKLGADIIKKSLDSKQCAVLTHCNAGALATGGYGTALGVIRSAWDNGSLAHVYADETRPWLQGARLTAWEMVEENIPVSILVEGAASHIIENSQQTDKAIKWIVVGSDRIASNGDVANKIGTYGLAILAKYHGIKFMVVAPTTTIDMNIATGKDIPIEQRSPQEVLSYAQSAIAATGAQAENPVFDVTPAKLVDAIVTERGVVLNPDLEKMKLLFK